MTTKTKTKPLDQDAVLVLADDLLAELAQHVGDPEAVNEVMSRWLDVLDVHGLSMVSMAAIRATFVDCLTMTDPSDWPTNGVGFNVKEIER